LDLIAYRALSDQIAKDFGVAHESPQILVIREGKVVYHESHYGISYATLMAQNS
jgi:bacillithiol system protein YtxJ